jgi:glycosyltransferase involved in cell wall biosynthesis
MMHNDPIVSICCLTYNHEPYIKQCLDGFLMQTGVNFEVLIHDDASTDGTASLIKEYEAKYPEIIKPIYQTENQYSKGVRPTFKFNFPRAKGEYIAFCEGDDYWTEPNKLQKQVDFLEANKDYVMCFTDRYFLNSRIGKIVETPFFYKEEQKTFTLRNINIYAPTLTRLFRNIGIPDHKNIIINDTVHLTWLANYGKLMYFREKTGVYRYNGLGAGTWSSLKFSDKLKHQIRSQSDAVKVAKDIVTKLRLNLSVSAMALQLWIETYPNPDLKIKDVQLPNDILWIIKTKNYRLIKIYNSILVRISKLVFLIFVKHSD